MDDIDVKLLGLLVDNSNQTATQLTKSVNLSVPAINKRISKLKESGEIKRFTIQVDAKKMGKPVMAYVMLILDGGAVHKEVIKVIEAERDIVECHAVTGDYDYLVKVYARDIDDLEETLLRLKDVNGVVKSNTMITLRTYCEQLSPYPD